MHVAGKRLSFNDNIEFENKIRLRQAEATTKLLKVVNKLQDKADKEKRIEIMEEIEDELRDYIWNYYTRCKHLPSWPDSKPIMFFNEDILGLPPIRKYIVFKFYFHTNYL